MENWLIIMGILFLFVVVVILVAWIEIRMDEAEKYYKCYSVQNYRQRASNFRCVGFQVGSRCQDCPYHKKYEKERKKDEERATL